MVEYVDSQKVAAKKNNFATLASAQNENVLKMRIEGFGPGRFKDSFSQIKEDSNLRKILKLVPLPKKRATRKKTIIVMMKRKMRKPKRLEKFGLMMKYSILIAPQGEMEFESAKHARKQVKF
jgi:hypothetical protein